MNLPHELHARTLAGLGRALILVGELASLGLAWLAIELDRVAMAAFFLVLFFGLPFAGRILFHPPPPLDERRRLEVAARIPRIH